ncbi:MAG TPA: DedA family protein [Burkholderiales bacterium]|jgi:membrane protein DedA with SNARE-associated domain
MNLPELIHTYGYWAVLGGTLLEGESVLLLAGFAAHRGHLELADVIGVAVVGGFVGDQVFFFLGRYKGQKVLERFPKYAAPAARAKELLGRYHIPLILSMRFLYGLRAALPFALGTGDIPVLRFQVLNLVGAILWSATIASAGYLFGHAVEYVLGDLKRYEEILFAVLAAGGFLYWLYTRRRRT